MVNRYFKTLILVASLTLGILVAVQAKSILTYRESVGNTRSKLENLQKQLDDEKILGRDLKVELNDNLEAKEAMLSELAYYNKNNTVLRRSWVNTNKQAGFSTVTGNGVIVTLNDSKTKGKNVLNSIVHDVDILRVINELKSAKAIAISINDERIITTSEIICAGPTIQINKNRYAVPFEIKAVGNKHDLYEYLNNSRFINSLKQYGISINISKQNNIVIPRYKGRTNLLVTGLEVVVEWIKKLFLLL